MIAIIDYDTGNLRSVANALARLGAQYVVTADHQVIRQADYVILPGVGEASSAMQKLRDRNLDTLIPALTQPVLGICIGQQLMCLHSEEGDTQCLGIFDTGVRRLGPMPGLKVPHMGWDTVESQITNYAFLRALTTGPYFYYVHSYAPDICADTIAVTEYGRPFSAILRRDNFTGVQFHPEKSGTAGAQFLKDWLS